MPAIDSHVVTESHRLRALPLSQLTVQDLRLLIGQEIGLDHLVPLALARLEEQPLAGGDFYPGDLLVALLRISPQFWHARRDWRRRLEQIARPVVERLTSMSHRRQQKLSLALDALKPAYDTFASLARATA